MGPTAETPPYSKARAIGVVYLLYFFLAVLAEYLVSRRLVVVGNALNLVAFADYAAVTLLFYGLFKPVDRNLSLLAAIMSLLGCMVGVLAVFHLAPSPSVPCGFSDPIASCSAGSSSGRHSCRGFWARSWYWPVPGDIHSSIPSNSNMRSPDVAGRDRATGVVVDPHRHGESAPTIPRARIVQVAMGGFAAEIYQVQDAPIVH